MKTSYSEALIEAINYANQKYPNRVFRDSVKYYV